MAGLVLGIRVASDARRNRLDAAKQVRSIRLLAQTSQARFGRIAGMGYVVQRNNAAPATDSIEIPGPLLLLEKNAPVRITVVNHLPVETAVHWHGIELESPSDGVPNWSGFEGRVMQPIAPRDSFVAEFTPPRAGTFMYHTHSNEQLQMGSGLYGALIVASPDHPFNPDIDKVILVGGAGPSDSLPQFGFASPGLVNGSNSPPPIEMKVGRTYRFRLININPDWRVVFSLLSESGMMSWRPVAKDGADIPPDLRRLRPAYLLTGPGETADFEFTPRRRGDLRFEVKTLLPGWIIPITIHVAE
jgi:FtsP/CotA-like multicopper oxidase with cupredoxin domain